MSWAPQVSVVETADKWIGNSLRFATQDEAMDNARDLANRWYLVIAFRAIESPDPANYQYVNNTLVPLKGGTENAD
jgi:hypothetical protein